MIESYFNSEWEEMISAKFDREGRCLECGILAEPRRRSEFIDWLGYTKMKNGDISAVSERRLKVHLENSEQLNLPVFRKVRIQEYTSWKVCIDQII